MMEKIKQWYQEQPIYRKLTFVFLLIFGLGFVIWDATIIVQANNAWQPSL